MKYTVIERPSEGTVNIIRRKAFDERIKKRLDEFSGETLGICQGTVLEILVASDAAEKTAGVVSGEVNGTCPNHMTCLAILGETSAVKAAIEGIKRRMEESVG